MLLGLWLRTRAARDSGSSEGDHPDVADAKRQFIEDVADHLSWHRRDRVRERYDDHAWLRIQASLPDGGGGTFYDPPA
jgi:hypothetical protein